MSGAAAVSAAKNRRTRETGQTQENKSKNVQLAQQSQPRQEMTFIQALHLHEARLQRNEEILKEILENTTGTELSSTMQEDTFDLLNERLASIEKYIDEELSKSLSLKEKEDNEGENVIYEKINGLESLLKEMKNELVRIQNSSRETNVSFLKYKKDTDGQLKELKDTLKALTETINIQQTPKALDKIESAAPTNSPDQKTGKH